jgi:hypothetical protein
MEQIGYFKLLYLFFGLILLTGFGIFFYPKIKIIKAKLVGGTKGLIYYDLHLIILKNKKINDYDPRILLNKYFKEVQNLPEKSDIILWNSFKQFWEQIFLLYPNELIKKLENEIDVTNDIAYFESLLYANHPTYKYISPDNKENIYKVLIDQGIKWANTAGKREQATRLGYFLIVDNYITLQEITQKGWLLAWNKALGLDESNYLKSIELIKNPLDTGANRTEESINKSIEEIRKLFLQLNWQNGIDLIDNLQS